MKDWTFIFAHGLISSAFLLVGLLALFLPQDKYSSMMGRLWLAGKAGGTGRQFQRRMVGLILALMGFFAVKGDVLSIYNPKPEGHGPGAPNPTFGGINPHWLPFLIALLVVGAGSFVAVNPEFLVGWSQQKLFPQRQFPRDVTRTWRVALRVMGGLMIFSSADLFKLWLKR